MELPPYKIETGTMLNALNSGSGLRCCAHRHNNSRAFERRDRLYVLLQYDRKEKSEAVVARESIEATT